VNRPQHSGRHNLSFIESFAEVVEEEKDEDKEDLTRRNPRLKMMKDKNEFNKKSKRNKSIDVLKCTELDMKPVFQFK
jgi:hypothetical protein